MHQRITKSAFAEEAFDELCSVKQWWTTNFEGSTRKLNDTFTLRFGRNKFTFKVVEYGPNKKKAWLVTDCHLPWLKDATESNDTKIVFELFDANGTICVDLTHVGLVPEVECYQVCEVGWDQYFDESIPKISCRRKRHPIR